jgi:uncharacterized protein (DUF983 family)
MIPPGAEPPPEEPTMAAARAPVTDLPASGLARLRRLLARAFTLRCPYCGGRRIFAGWMTLKADCPTCSVHYEREDGYFLGAYALNLIVAEFIGLGGAIYLLFATDLRNLPLGWQMVLAGTLAVVLPILFFPFSRTLWIALDLLFDRSSRSSQRHLRGHEMTERPPRRP